MSTGPEWQTSVYPAHLRVHVVPQLIVCIAGRLGDERRVRVGDGGEEGVETQLFGAAIEQHLAFCEDGGRHGDECALKKQDDLSSMQQTRQTVAGVGVGRGVGGGSEGGSEAHRRGFIGQV